MTEAIVTGSRRYAEADKILTLITIDKGRIGAIAKSSRKPKSTLRGATEPFVQARFELAVAKSLAIVRSVEIINPHLGIRESWQRIQLAGHVAEIANRISEENFPDPELYELVRDALDAIDRGDTDAVVVFKANVLEHLGVFPDLTGCSKCGAIKVRGYVHVDSQRHGFLCETCAKESHIWQPVSMKVLHVLYSLNTGKGTGGIDDVDFLNQADDVMTILLQGFMQHGLKTAEAVKSMREKNPLKDKGEARKDDTKSDASER